MDDKKRRLPRHVDGRIMLYKMPIKSLPLFLPIAIPVVVGTIALISTTGSPLFLVLGILVLGVLVGLFSEFNQRETGIDMLKDMIRYMKEGEIEYERSCLNAPAYKRYIWNKIKKSN